MKLTEKAAYELAEEMLKYEIRMAEIAEILHEVKNQQIHNFVVKASAYAEMSESAIFTTRNVLSVAFGNKLTHKLARPEEESNEQTN